MEHVEGVDHEYPTAMSGWAIGNTGIPYGVGGIEFFRTISSACIAYEVGACAEYGGEFEDAGYAIVEVVGVDGLEIGLCRGCVPVGVVATQQ